MPKQSEDATKGLRIINSADPCVSYLDYRRIIVPLQLLVTRKQHENVAVITPVAVVVITWLLINNYLSNARL